MEKQKTKHEIIRFEELSSLNSSYLYNEGYNRVCCSCGWKSCGAKDDKVLVAIWKAHVELIKE